MHRINQIPNEIMKRIPMPITSSSVHLGNDSQAPDLLWISKQQQQHPATHMHPLKNTVRVNSNGTRYKFDGKQWRQLCKSSDDEDCRNFAFRSLLCQKHFYKSHLLKRSYVKNDTASKQLPGIPPVALKRPLSHPYEHQYQHHYPQNDSYTIENGHEDNDSILFIDNNDSMTIQRDNMGLKNESQSGFNFFTIDCDQQSEFDKQEIDHLKSLPLPKMKRLDSTNNESFISNESENTSLGVLIPSVTESIRLCVPPLTRTEEKSLANELITQLPTDASLTTAEQMARHRASEIIMDNYSHHLSSINIASEWFYDFLLRNPRVPIHFQSWFSSVKPTMPSTDFLIDIKLWELGLITRSIMPSSSNSSSSSSP